MALGKNLATGRFDADQNAVMKRVRKPRFVDNAVRHGEYTKVSGGFAVNKPTNTDFVPTTEKRYKLIEENDTIKLMHNPTDSMTYEGALFYDTDKVTTSSTLPPLIVASEDNNQSLIVSEIKTANKGTRYGLENMKGKSLPEIGFTDKTVRFAQKLGVGLRTSDLAIKVSKGTQNSLSGVKAKSPSGTFVAQDFLGVEASSALRFLSKHDGYGPRNDRYGNICYFPQNQIEREYLLTENKITGGIDTDSNESVPNRVIVRGQARANNDDNAVQVDDFGSQADSVNEVPGGIFAPTAVTKASARLIGRRMLKMAKNATGSRKMRDVVMSTQMHPGDMVSYRSRVENERYVVLGAKHNLVERTSDLHVNSVDVTLEDVLQRFQEVDISGSLEANLDRNRQFKVEEFSTAFGFKMKVSWEIAERVDINKGKGHTLGIPRRSAINGRLLLQNTGVLINNGSGHAIGTTSFTVDGVNATTIFTTDNQAVYTENGNKLGHIHAASVGATTVVIKTASVHPVSDNDELFILSTATVPETNNNYLTIGTGQSSYLRSRRG